MSKKVKKSRAIIDDDDDEDELVEKFEKTSKKFSSNALIENNEDDEEDEEEEGDDVADEEDDDDEDDEDNEQPEEFNDFIADEEEEEEEEQEPDEATNSEHHKSKKRKKDKKKKKKRVQTSEAGSRSSSSNESMSELSDDDLDLIKDNLEVDDLEQVGIKRRKRRIEVRSESSDEEAEPARHIEPSGPKKTKQNELVDAEPSDDEGSFIVDDTDDEAQPNRADHAHAQKKKRMYTDDAQQEALDIFGVNADELGVGSDDERANDDYEDDEEADEDQEYDDETYEKAANKRNRLKTMHKIEDIFEPQELERNLLTELDQQIRIEDKPERFMLRQVPVSAEPDEYELEKEAEWILHRMELYEQLDEDKQALYLARVKEVLGFIRNELLEVPFIAQYRKEHYEPELGLEHLWKIYDLDEKYCQLNQRKQSLYRLLERMQSYLKSTGARVHRPLTDLDLQKVKDIQNIDQFLDHYNHFHLHYNSDLAAMKEHELKMTIIERETKRAEMDNGQLDDEDQPDDDQYFANMKLTKHASKKDAFNYCKAMGIGQLADRFGLSAQDYAENLHADYAKHDIDQESVEPEQLAGEFMREPFESVEQILAMCRYMLAVQFAKEPSIRAYFRDLYMQRVCVNIKASVPRGLNEIDENHPCYAYKYVKMKPVSEIKQDEYLKLCQAEQDGLVSFKFECAGLVESFARAKKDHWHESIIHDDKNRSIVDKLKSFYQKDEFSYNVEQWNKQRALVVEEMCFKFLMPEMEREVRSRLATEAKQYVFKQCCDTLENMVKIAPYNPTIESIDDEEDRLRVLAISYTTVDDDQSIDYCCACVNTDGALNEPLYLKKLHVRTRSRDAQSMPSADVRQKLDEMDKLEAFVESKRPKVIVVAAENKEALFIQEELTDMVKKLGLGISVELIDSQVARLCESSKLCQQEFGASVPALLRTAVHLARYIQDPLLCVSQLCNQDRDILGLKLHPMMQYIISASGSRSSDDATQLLKQLEVKLINVVNDVGVDMNRCDVEPHTSGVLQYVCGLGPRKAAHILKVLKAERLDLKGKLPSTKEFATYPVFPNRLCLVTKCSLGRKVFINCSGFIKLDVDKISKEIDEDEDESQDEANYTDPLDSTRIHLESYEWAKKIAIDALDLDENSEAANSRTALKEILENPRRLKDLDLDAFADELMRTGYGNKLTTLYDIRQELFYRYRDRRVPYTPMDPVQRFYTLIHETPDTFSKGKLITCRVTGISRRRPTKEQLDAANPVKDENSGMWKCTFCQKNDFNEIGKVWAHFDTDECPGPPVGVRTMLENGCQGFIALRNLSDNQVSNPEDRIKVGMIIHARIRELDPEKFRIDLTSRTSDLRDDGDKWKPSKDPYYDYRSAQEDRERLDEKKKREQHKQVYTKRVISHPHFKNVGYAQAVEMLKEADIGEAIIRPSSKGSDHLTVTWKVGPGCYQHVDVLEEKKANSFSLGKKLVIQGEEYEDLDEILARFISPMVALVREVMCNKYYKTLEELDLNGDIKVELVERFLLEERQKQPSKIPYVFLQCINLPCKFMLAYMIKHKMRCEYLTVTSEGFRFRQKIFRSFNELVTWFKQHFNDPIPQPLSQINQSQTQLMSQMSTMSVSNTTSQPMQIDDWDEGAQSLHQASQDGETNVRDNFQSNRERSGFSDRGRGGRGGFRGRGGFERGRGGRGSNRGGFRGGRGANNDFRRNNDWNSGSRRQDDDDNWNARDTNASQNWKNSSFEAKKNDYVPPSPPRQPQAVINNDDEMWD